MTSTKFRRYWYKPVRSIVTGLGAGTALAWIFYHGSLPVALLTALGLVVALLWVHYIVWQPQTSERVEQFMTERCRCGHTRRDHAVEFITQPVCSECDCDWMLPPIVYGPWDPRFKTLRREHQERVIYGDVVALGLAVLFLCAWL